MVQGKELYELLIELTGLDRNCVDAELGSIIQKLGLKHEELTTDDLRKIVTVYLAEVQQELLGTIPQASLDIVLAEA